MQDTEVFLSKSVCLAVEMLKAGLRQMSICGIVQQMNMATPLMGDQERGSRVLAMFTLVCTHRGSIGVNANCQVFCTDGVWNFGDIRITTPDATGDFHCELSDTGELTTTRSETTDP